MGDIYPGEDDEGQHNRSTSVDAVRGRPSAIDLGGDIGRFYGDCPSSSHTHRGVGGAASFDSFKGIYGYPIEIQALFFMALRSALSMLKHDAEGKEFIERIVKRLHTLSYHMRIYFWLDFQQLNDIYRYKTEEYSHTAVYKFNVIPDSIPEWVFDFMPTRGGYFIGNVSPARMDFRWFPLGNCVAILSSLATPEQAYAIMDLFEEIWEELVGEMPLKIAYPATESHGWRIVTGCDPKNTRWSYHNGGSWPGPIFLGARDCRPSKSAEGIGLNNWSFGGGSSEVSCTRGKGKINNFKWEVLIPVANGSEEIEVVTIIDILRRANASVIVASVEKSLQIVGSSSTKIIADKMIGDVADSTYDVIILSGGTLGTEKLHKSRILKKLLKEQLGWENFRCYRFFTYNSTQTRVVKAEPTYEEQPWPTLSTEAKDFVKRLLSKDPRKRMTAAQALWFHARG